MGRRGHAEPREALIVNGETEAGDESVWKKGDWRWNCCKESFCQSPAARLPSRGHHPSLLWPEVEGRTDPSCAVSPFPSRVAVGQFLHLSAPGLRHL